jgi:dephospho-CoA kinase
LLKSVIVIFANLSETCPILKKEYLLPPRRFGWASLAAWAAEKRRLIVNDLEVKLGVLELFGPEAYLPDGSYNRVYVAGIVFQNPEKLQALNALVHPAVERHGRDWHVAQKNAPYTLKEAALLVESGGYRHLDALIVVTAPEALRIRRVMQRDGLDEAAVRARLAKQIPEENKVKLADFVIVNDGKQLLIPQVLAIHCDLIGRIDKMPYFVPHNP